MVTSSDTFDLAALTAELTRDEASRPKLYDDATGHTIERGTMIRGKVTGGIGHNFSDDGLSPDQIAFILQGDISGVEAALDGRLPWWRQLSNTRQRVLLNMCFNLGIDGLLSFVHTLTAIENGQYEQAAQGMEQSRWASQVGQRATRLITCMRTGTMPGDG